MINTDSLAKMAQVAECAVAVHYRETARKHRKNLLNEAYRNWKHDNSIMEHLERDSDEWGAMLVGTKTEYDDLEKAKRQERSARQRLDRAVRKFLNS